MDARFVARYIVHVICVVIAIGIAARTPAAAATLSDRLHRVAGGGRPRKSNGHAVCA